MTTNSDKTIIVSSGTIIRGFLIALGFYLLYLLRDLALVVVLAIVIASAIEPVTQRFVRRGVPRILAVLLIYFVLTIILVVIFYFLFLPMLTQTLSFLTSLPSYLGELQVWNPLKDSSFLSGNSTIQGLSENFSLAQIVTEINTVVTRYSNGFFSTASSIFGGVLSLLLVIVLSFYLSVEADGVTNFLKIVVPLHHEKYVIDLWKRSQAKIALWMQGQIVLAIIIAVLVFLGLTLLRIENPLLLAVLAGVFEIIPLFGPILAAIPSVTVALITNGFSSALIVVGLYIIVQQFLSSTVGSEAWNSRDLKSRPH